MFLTLDTDLSPPCQTKRISMARSSLIIGHEQPGLSKNRVGEPFGLPDGVGINHTYNPKNTSQTQHWSPPSWNDGPSSVSKEASPSSSSSIRSSSALIDENIKIDGSRVVLTEIRSSFDEKSICSLLSDLGFHKQPKIVISQDNSVSLDFSHLHVAHAAYSILRHRAGGLWTINYPAETRSSHRAPDVNIESSCAEMIDLTGVEDELDEDQPNGNLCRSVYEDDGDSNGSIDSDENTLTSGYGRIPSPAREPMIPPSETFPASRISAYLSKTFELPEADANGSIPLEIRKARDLRASPPAFGTSLPTPYHKRTRNDIVNIHTVNVPKAPFNKARRILLPKDTELPIATVSMRADIQFFNRKERHRISIMSVPNDSVYRHTVDAKMIDNRAVIGFGDGPCQVALVRLDSEGSLPSLTELKHAPHKVQTSDAGRSKGRGAVSCLAAKGTHFITGGYDKSLILWSMEGPDSVTTEKLTSLTTIPEALAVRDKNLLVGTSQKLLELDLAHLSAKPVTNRLSNAVRQIHTHNQAPDVTILEVDSMDFQVQIFDTRKRGFNIAADCSFGTRHGDCSTRSNTTRFGRGDTDLSLFVKGFEDGTVVIWDYRSLKRPIITQKYEDMGSIVHTVFAGSNIVCYGKRGLTFVDISRIGSD